MNEAKSYNEGSVAWTIDPHDQAVEGTILNPEEVDVRPFLKRCAIMLAAEVWDHPLLECNAEWDGPNMIRIQECEPWKHKEYKRGARMEVECSKMCDGTIVFGIWTV